MDEKRGIKIGRKVRNDGISFLGSSLSIYEDNKPI